jgi:predicted nucleic acid-binding protein
MRKYKIYLDTSVINFLFADDSPEKKEVTVDFFSGVVKHNIYEIFVSPIVVDEINKTQDNSKRLKLLGVIKKYNIPIIEIASHRDEIERLALLYINSKIIPVNKLEDALHIAIATVFEFEILLSWNYKHLANVNKERQILVINVCEGYSKPFRLITPMEVSYG